MSFRHRTPVLVWTLLIAAGVASACANKGPKPVNTRMTVAASADTNPDQSGRPSPVVVRVFQLKADAAFAGADFFALYDDEQKVLGADLISRTEFVMAPSDKRTVDLQVSGEAKFVGAIAAFRDIRNSQWRVLVPAQRKDVVTVAVERARVSLSITD